MLNLCYKTYLYIFLVPVQPSKLYFINARVLNKLGGTILLRFSDNLPVNGFLIKSNMIATIKKKTNNPTAVTIRAEDPITKKVLYVNDLPNFRVTPSQFEEQLTDITVSGKSGIDGKSILWSAVPI